MADGRRMIVVLSSPSVAERVAAAGKRPSASEEKEWTADIRAMQASFLAALERRGVKIEPERDYTHVLNGFSAILDGKAVSELERNPLVVGLYPVRSVYPAEARSSGGPGESPGLSLAGYDGNGVRIALLDTGVDRSHPALHGRVGSGHDFVGDDGRAVPERSADGAARLETHGTRMAGLALRVAPGARIVPLRILGWQTTDDGAAVIGRGDDLVAGLELAVDPNGDGATKDAIPIALAPVIEPFAAFADSPEARAVTGATDLGTLVVAPSGNDGAVGVGFGAVGAPGAAADALSVGALDTRRGVFETQLRLDVGGKRVTDEPARFLGGVTTGAETLDVAALIGPSLDDAAREAGSEAGGSHLGDYFDPTGVSRVAGKAALVPADGTALAQRAANAKTAGAAALLVYGTDVPAGALDVDDAGALPVLAVSGTAGADAVEGLRSGKQVVLQIGSVRAIGNGTAGRVAPFSSGGLAFDGRVRPDVVAPGVGLATADARSSRRGRALYATATGTSAAVAVAAGTAALVAQARPGLDPRALKGILVGSASSVGEAATREGAGLLDPAAATETELAVQPSELAFGRASGGAWTDARKLTVTNVSDHMVDVVFASVSDQPGSEFSFTAEPARLKLGPGASSDVTLAVSAKPGARRGTSGVVLAIPRGADPTRIPWAVVPSRGREALVGSVSISNWEFQPSTTAPSVLAFTAGRADTAGDGTIEPVGLLDVELWTSDGRKLGVIARLRDLLPGRYAIGLTGRDADGKVLPVGTYVLRLRAQPVDSEDGTTPSTAQTVFRIKERS